MYHVQQRHKASHSHSTAYECSQEIGECGKAAIGVNKQDELVE